MVTAAGWHCRRPGKGVRAASPATGRYLCCWGRSGLPLELALDGVELEPDALLPRLLPGKYEGPRYATVLDEPLAVRPPQDVRRLHGRRPRRVRDGYDDVNVVIGLSLGYLIRELLPHLEPGLVYAYPVHDGVRTG